MTNLAASVLVGCVTGMLLGVIGISMTLVRIAEALEKMNVRLALLIRGEP